jgi:hypothetical protein
MKFDLAKMFEPNPYREIAAESIREYMQEREYSIIPDIRHKAHFEGYLSPFQFNKAISFSIDESDIIAMKKVGYRMLEFGRYNWNKVINAMEIYKQHYGHVNIPSDFIINEEIMSDIPEYDESFEDLHLGESKQKSIHILSFSIFIVEINIFSFSLFLSR